MGKTENKNGAIDWAIDCAADFLRRRGHVVVETGAACKVQGRAVIDHVANVEVVNR